MSGGHPATAPQSTAVPAEAGISFC
jgi:hypothetical protein